MRLVWVRPVQLLLGIREILVFEFAAALERRRLARGALSLPIGLLLKRYLGDTGPDAWGRGRLAHPLRGSTVQAGMVTVRIAVVVR